MTRCIALIGCLLGSVFIPDIEVFTAQADILAPSARLLTATQKMVGKVARAEESQGYVPLIVKLTDVDAEVPEGVVELYRRDNIMLAYVPEEKIEELAQSGYFTRMEGRVAASPALDKARTFTGFDRVAAADGLPRAYTGRGVVVGFTDAGFDPNHIEFIDPQSNLPRTKLLTHYTINPEELTRIDSPSEISNWTTDSYDYFHATHVAGILAGGYRGNPYHGIAPEADIVASTSEMYDALMLAGMEDVVRYARTQAQPAAINMSISCSVGPHDGTSLFSEYMSKLAQEAVVCIAAGNDGMRNGRFTATFADSRSAALKLVDYPNMEAWYANGAVDVWAEDATPLNFAIIILDRTTGEVAMRVPLPKITVENPEIYCEFSEEFSEFMEGEVVMASELNPINNRFNATFIFDLYNYKVNDVPSTRYCVGLEMSGPDGSSVEAFGSDNLYLKAVNGYLGAVSTNGTINDFITGDGVIGVGALTSRTTWPMVYGEDGTSNYTEGKIADFSSFRAGSSHSAPLPDIVAPGAHLVSALSGPYVDENPNDEAFSLIEDVNFETYYWRADCGTSMASPYVTGVCALMLEANPDLSPAEIKEIITSTASAPVIDAGSPRWGGGILNSHAAILAAAERASLPGITTTPIIDSNRPAEVYTPEGVMVATAPSDEMSRLSLPSGVYILRQGSNTSKILIR